MRALLTFICAGFFFLCLLGCSSGLKIKSDVRPFVTDIKSWPEIYFQNFQQIDTFTGKARLTIESEQFSGHVSMESYWIRPHKLFVQAEGPLGLDVAKMFVGENRFIVYNQYSNHFTAGSVHDPFLNRFWQTNFTLNELKSTLLGFAIQSGEVLDFVDPENGVFSAVKDDIEYRYVVNPESGLLESCLLLRNARIFLRQDFKNYQIFSGIYIPTLVYLTMPEQKERISIFYKEIKLNTPIDSQKYTIEISPKVQQLNLN